ncbi:hypothetical protein [Mycoplasmopsis felis]
MFIYDLYGIKFLLLITKTTTSLINRDSFVTIEIKFKILNY